jgi:hypothetical protein
MKNQFFYKIKVQTGTEKEPKEDIIIGSFNINKVVRSIGLPGDRLLVVLDDFHEEIVTQPNQINPRTNRVIVGKKEKAVVHSELELEPEDKERFMNLLNIE